MSTELQSPILNPDLQALVDQLLQSGACDIYQIVIAEADRQILQQVLGHCKGNISRACRMLKISRSTLRKKLAAAKMNDDQKAESE